MPERDNRQPVEQRHIDFGREVAALARKHGFRNINAEFYGGDDGQRWTKVSMHWNEGRHGEQNRISFRAEATHHCEERAPDAND